uniref:Uncharacterized protein n=1 Tax=Romanomermis culicivorax TaxID=13658 RepID=A0A915L273_ROMCU
MTNCYYAKGGGSRPKRDLESLQRISSTERRCIPEKELQEKENERYALFGRNELDMERAQNCMGLPEEAVLMFCWATNCGCMNLGMFIIRVFEL